MRFVLVVVLCAVDVCGWVVSGERQSLICSASSTPPGKAVPGSPLGWPDFPGTPTTRNLASTTPSCPHSFPRHFHVLPSIIISSRAGNPCTEGKQCSCCQDSSPHFTEFESSPLGCEVPRHRRPRTNCLTVQIQRCPIVTGGTRFPFRFFCVSHLDVSVS